MEPTFRLLKKAPSSDDWPTFPVKKPTPGRPSVHDVEAITSKPLIKAVEALVAAQQKALSVEAELKAAKKKLADEFGVRINEGKTTVRQDVKAVWRLLEKNREALVEGREAFGRIESLIVGARGPRTTVSEPVPMEDDPRVEAILQFVTERMPGLLDEFYAIIHNIEEEYLESQSEEDRTSISPPELAVYDLGAEASSKAPVQVYRKAGPVWSRITEWLISTYRRMTGFLAKVHQMEDSLQALMGAE